MVKKYIRLFENNNTFIILFNLNIEDRVDGGTKDLINLPSKHDFEEIVNSEWNYYTEKEKDYLSYFLKQDKNKDIPITTKLLKPVIKHYPVWQKKNDELSDKGKVIPTIELIYTFEGNCDKNILKKYIVDKIENQEMFSEQILGYYSIKQELEGNPENPKFGEIEYYIKIGEVSSL